MPSAAADDFLADITTAPIFDDALYFSEALNLPSGQNEDDVDARLALSARESGIEDPYRYLAPHVPDLSTAMSTITLCSEQRSSMSIHSRETQSTGITSHPSRNSRDHSLADHLPVLHTQPAARDYLSLDYYDIVMDRFRPPIRHRHSSSTVSRATSLISHASSLPALLPPRKHKRASGLFAMFRKDSSSCSSRSHHGHHDRPQSPRLECGHSLSRYAVRIHVQEALENNNRVVPNCCGRPLPRAVLETVLSKEEVDIVTSVALPSPDIAPLPSPGITSLQDSGCSEDGRCLIDTPHMPQSPALPSGSFATTQAVPSSELAPMDQEGLDLALANEAFKSLRSQQREEFERVSRFEANQRKALSAYYSWSQTRLTCQHESLKEEKLRRHALELEQLDECQIVAEHDMRKAHTQEAQNVATALKYMEAYCSGNNLSNLDVVHTVTDDDRRKLARQRLLLEKLPAKQDSAINVLRARQEKDTKLKVQRQQAELRQLDADYEGDKRTAEIQHLKDSNRLDVIIASRRHRVLLRWDLTFEIWRKNWESQHGSTLSGRFPHEPWPVSTDQDGPLDVTSSLALYEAKVRLATNSALSLPLPS